MTPSRAALAAKRLRLRNKAEMALSAFGIDIINCRLNADLRTDIADEFCEAVAESALRYAQEAWREFDELRSEQPDDV